MSALHVLIKPMSENVWDMVLPFKVLAAVDIGMAKPIVKLTVGALSGFNRMPDCSNIFIGDAMMAMEVLLKNKPFDIN